MCDEKRIQHGNIIIIIIIIIIEKRDDQSMASIFVDAVITHLFFFSHLAPIIGICQTAVYREMFVLLQSFVRSFVCSKSDHHLSHRHTHTNLFVLTVKRREEKKTKKTKNEKKNERITTSNAFLQIICLHFLH